MGGVIFILSACLLLVVGARGFNEVNLPLPEKEYKILFLLPFGGASHRNAMLPIAEALAKRNHHVVILSGLPPVNIHPRLIEVQHDLFEKAPPPDFFGRRESPASTFRIFSKVLPNVAREIYKNDNVIKLYEERHQFDLFIVDELFNELAYPFVHGVPFIILGTLGLTPGMGLNFGNPLHPAFFPGLTYNEFPPYSFWQRIINLYDHLHFTLLWKYWHVVPKVQEEISKQFPDLPPLLELERNASLVLVQSHVSLRPPTPLLPTQVEIGGHICKDPKPLPKDLLDWIEDAPSGVIYFSLGSAARGISMPNKYFEIIKKAFKQLDQRIIWKYEQSIDDLPANVLTQKWLPQQDIISHPNVKLFMTHGGLLSLIEASCHGIPLLAFPILGDQLKNANYIVHRGFGRALVWEELTVENVVISIQSILQNESYSTSIKEASRQFMDLPEPPLQRAIWWTEYVIRNNGAPILKSPAASLNIIQYFMIDIIGFFMFTIFLLGWLMKEINPFK